MKKKLVYLCMFSLLSILLLAGCGNKEKKNNPYYDSDNYLTGTHYAVMDIKDYGAVFLELYADQAPATVTNFVNLVNEGFYNDLTFHRIMEGFMMQGGDPAGDGSGMAKYTIPGEFVLNDFNNTISHVRGTISMARTENDYNSASCQFFIVHEDTIGLDGHYAAFGKVISGMGVIDAICANAIVEDDNGTVLKKNQPVIDSIAIIEKEAAIFDTSADSKPEEPELPSSSAVVSIAKVNNPEQIVAVDKWPITEGGNTYFLTSSENLLSLALYDTDFTRDIPYNEDAPLAYSRSIGAGSFVSMQITLPEGEALPSKIIVAEEYTGAISMYLLSYDPNAESIYLIPVGN